MEDQEGYGDYIYEKFSIKSDVDLTEMQVNRIIKQYVSPVFLIFGTIFNVVTVITLLLLCRHIVPSCLYILVGAIVDTFVLWLECGNEWLTSLLMVDIRRKAMLINPSFCKIFPFVSDFTSHMSVWMLVAVSIETGLSFTRPKRLFKICAFERARAVVLLIMVLLLCINAHCFWSFALIADDTTKDRQLFCTTKRQGNSEVFWRYIMPVGYILMVDLFPLCLVLSFTVVTMTRWHRFKSVVNMKGDNNNRINCKINSHKGIIDIETVEPTKNSSKLNTTSIRNIHWAVLCLSVTYLILLGPKCVVDIFSYFTSQTGLGLVPFSIQLEVKTHLAKTVCLMLMYMWLSCKFCVFMVCVPVFREQVHKQLIKCKSCRKRRRGLPPANKPLLPLCKHVPEQCTSLARTNRGHQDFSNSKGKTLDNEKLLSSKTYQQVITIV